MQAYKVILGILAITAIISIGTANNSYPDVICGVYNSTTIETANYQYVIVYDSQIPITSDMVGRNITVEPIGEIGNTLTAIIYI